MTYRILGRRTFVRTGLLGGAGALVGTGLVGCEESARVAQTIATTPETPLPPVELPERVTTAHATAQATGAPPPTATPAPDAAALNAEHDAAAEAVVKRFPEKTDRHGNQPLAPKIEGDWKVFDLTCSDFAWQIDALKPPVNAWGYNETWPGPILRVTEGDNVRLIVKNLMAYSTSVHPHGQSVPNAMDGVPFITQPPIKPGESFTYEFVAGPPGSHMYHSHHNATDQVGRGLLGAFIVDQKDEGQRLKVDQDVVWISNDTLGGFTINGKGFPATQPIVATKGQRVLIRFMNEGLMMHPWHLHGMPMRVVARDGYPLGAAEFTCDTLGVNPGERWDVVVTCDNPGVWAFHCHILTHAEGAQGMFGMVNALIVNA